MAPTNSSTHNETMWTGIGPNMHDGDSRAVNSTMPWQGISTVASAHARQMTEGGRLYRLAFNSDESTSSPVKPVKQTITDCLLTVINAAGTVADAARFRNEAGMVGSAVGAEDMFKPRDNIGMQPYKLAGQLPLSLHESGNVGRQKCCHGDAEIPGDSQNCHLINMLCERGYNIAEDDQRVASSMMIKAIVTMVQKDPKAKRWVARKILRDLGYYGGHKTERISSDYQSRVLVDLIIRELFDGNVEDFIVTQLSATTNLSQLTTASVSDVLRKRIYESLLLTDTDDQPNAQDLKIKQWIWQHVVLDALPILRHEQDDQGNPFDLHQPLWGQIHAGLQFVKAAGVDPATVSQAQALAVAKMLHAELNEKIILPEWARFFWLPAQCHAALTRPEQEPRLGQSKEDVVVAYFAFVEQFVDARCPVTVFQKALSGFQTRPQLAKRIIDENCPSMEVDSLLNWGSSICWKLPFPHVENVNDVYPQEVAAVANAYANFDKLLVMSAWSKLADAEIDFIDSAKIQRMQACFTAADTIRDIPLGRAYHGVRDSLTVQLGAGVELFAARCGGEERIYVLRREGAGYDINRIDRNTADYYELLDDSRPQFDSDYVLKINGLGDTVERKSAMFAELIRICVARHTEMFSQQLHAFGYEKTTTEKVVDFALSLLPFYTCISESRSGNVGGAALACSIDILLLVPVIGIAGKLSIKFGQAFSRGSFVAMQTATSEVAARQALRTVLKNGASDFVQYGLVPASEIVGRKEVALAGRALFNAYDPGLQLIGQLGRKSMQQAIKLGHFMEMHLPALKEILPKLNSRLEKRLVNADVITNASGFLPGIANAVKIKHIPMQYLDSRPVYVQVHPETGALFGRKYTLADDGRLQVIPIDTMQRIRHLREQGLGGRGAIGASKVLAAETQDNALAVVNANARPITAQLLRTVQGRAVGVGGVEQLARHQGDAASELVKYLNEPGQLTEAGNAMLAQADAAEMGSSAVSLDRLDDAAPHAPVSDMHLDAWQHLSQEQRDLLGINNFCQMYGIDINAFRDFLKQNQALDLPVPVPFEVQPQPLAPMAEENLVQSGSTPVSAAEKTPSYQFESFSDEILKKWTHSKWLRAWRLSPEEFVREHRLNPREWAEKVDSLGNVRVAASSAADRPSGVIAGRTRGERVGRPGNDRTVAPRINRGPPTEITEDLLDQWRLFAHNHPGPGNQRDFLHLWNVKPRDWVSYVDAEGKVIKAAPANDNRMGSVAAAPGPEAQVFATARQHSSRMNLAPEYKRPRNYAATPLPSR